MAISAGVSSRLKNFSSFFLFVQEISNQRFLRVAVGRRQKRKKKKETEERITFRNSVLTLTLFPEPGEDFPRNPGRGEGEEASGAFGTK